VSFTRHAACAHLDRRSFAPSLAHDWCPTACCSERDCRSLVEGLGETVLEAAGRFELWDGRTVDRDKA
jgi:hypothetical protein